MRKELAMGSVLCYPLGVGGRKPRTESETTTKMNAYTFSEILIITKNEATDSNDTTITKFVVVAETYDDAKAAVARSIKARFGSTVTKIDFWPVSVAPINGATVIDSTDV
jgi:hypothetical protein